MKQLVPDYYKDFKCAADRCRHTCCVGWEIDIDEFTLEKYGRIHGILGDKLRENIENDGCPHFRLTEDERCPFLDENNLCELILNLGENSLCRICTDHPRFRSYFYDRTETGLGLCCEVAAGLILSRKEKFSLIEESDDGVTETPVEVDDFILEMRTKALKTVQDRKYTIEERIKTLISEFEINIPQKSFPEWSDFFMSLERLDSIWDEKLLQLKNYTCGENNIDLSDLEIPLEQLVSYFIYRHVPSSQDETDVNLYLEFAILSYKIIRQLCITGNADFDGLAEIARLYSSEIEYSDENIDEILKIL